MAAFIKTGIRQSVNPYHIMATKGSVFTSLQGLPSSFGAGEIYSSMNPISTGVDLPASESDREFKKKYDTENIFVATDGFTLYASLMGAKAFEMAGGNGGGDGDGEACWEAGVAG